MSLLGSRINLLWPHPLTDGPIKSIRHFLLLLQHWCERALKAAHLSLCVTSQGEYLSYWGMLLFPLASHVNSKPIRRWDDYVEKLGLACQPWCLMNICLSLKTCQKVFLFLESQVGSFSTGMVCIFMHCFYFYRSAFLKKSQSKGLSQKLSSFFFQLPSMWGETFLSKLVCAGLPFLWIASVRKWNPQVNL